MPETVSDTGPVLHLQEIGKLPTLAIVAPLIFPDFVFKELEARGVDYVQLGAAIDFTVSPVQDSEWRGVLRDLAPQIQPADAQVFVLVRASRFEALTRTDDLTLRRLLESYGSQVTGTVGILVRAYASGRITRDDLEASVESLSGQSSLFISRAFQVYLKKLLADLP